MSEQVCELIITVMAEVIVYVLIKIIESLNDDMK